MSRSCPKLLITMSKYLLNEKVSISQENLEQIISHQIGNKKAKTIMGRKNCVCWSVFTSLWVFCLCVGVKARKFNLQPLSWVQFVSLACIYWGNLNCRFKDFLTLWIFFPISILSWEELNEGQSKLAEKQSVSTFGENKMSLI